MGGRGRAVPANREAPGISVLDNTKGFAIMWILLGVIALSVIGCLLWYMIAGMDNDLEGY